MRWTLKVLRLTRRNARQEVSWPRGAGRRAALRIRRTPATLMWWRALSDPEVVEDRDVTHLRYVVRK
jgi:hypothetical protein